jgi:hypothetical protein
MRTTSSRLTVLLSFDEAHVLTSKAPGMSSTQKVLLDHLASALNEFRPQSLFAIFLSTQSDIESFAPSFSFARSARIRHQLPDSHAPITETPFDCFERAIIPSRLKAKHTGNIAFMALFGRPL